MEKGEDQQQKCSCQLPHLATALRCPVIESWFIYAINSGKRFQSGWRDTAKCWRRRMVVKKAVSGTACGLDDYYGWFGLMPKWDKKSPSFGPPIGLSNVEELAKVGGGNTYVMAIRGEVGRRLERGKENVGNGGMSKWASEWDGRKRDKVEW